MRIAGVVVALLSSSVLAAPAPKVGFAAPKLTGAVDTKLVGTALRAAQTKLGDCYTKARMKAPELKGTATVTFTIAADGKAVAASATGLNQEAEACISGVIGKLAFGKPTDGKPVEASVAISFGPGVEEALDDKEGVLGSLDGTSGSFGGCGQGWGTIGTGRYGTIGHGSGTGYGISCGGGGMRGRRATVPVVTIGLPTVTGDLDKAIIRRYIKRNMMKLTYCYEKQLLAKPKLQGTVRVEFVIGGNGLVTSSSAKGTVDRDVETCMADVIKGIEFPRPKNGKDVKASYPFTAKPSGG